MSEIIEINDSLRKDLNNLATHPLQSFEWGEFREKTGIKVIRRGLLENEKLKAAYTITIHKIPHTNFTIGYLPKCTILSKELLDDLISIAKQEKCIFIQLEPNLTVDKLEEFKKSVKNYNIINSFHPLFTKYTFILDITKSDEELLRSFHPKTRYNIKVAQKKGVVVKEENSEEAFEIYLKLTEETTKRQNFYAHTKKYHTLMWETLRQAQDKISQKSEKLTAHLFIATINNEETNNKIIPLVAWVLFVFHDKLYYPYGASSDKFRNAMASNLMMWEAIKFGKSLNLKSFDMWGALGANPDTKDPWHGFHKFKQGYGATHTEFIGSFDFVMNKGLYNLYKIVDKSRWAILRLKKFI